MFSPAALSNYADQAAHINQVMAEDAVMHADRREKRRIIAEAQEKSSGIVAAVCTDIVANTPPDIKRFIDGLRETQPAVHNYIRNLMVLKYSIWCPKCDQLKSFSGRDGSEVEADVESELATGEDCRMHPKKEIPVHARKASTEYSSHPHVPALTGAPALLGMPTGSAAPRAHHIAAREPQLLAYQSVGGEKTNPFDTLDERIVAIAELRDDLAKKLDKLDAYIGELRSWQGEPASSAKPNSGKMTQDDVERRIAAMMESRFGGADDADFGGF